jgi:predicted DNA-binding protein
MTQATRTKAMSIRVSVEQAEALEMLARFDRCSVAEQIRQAITNHIETRRGDQAYIAQLRDDLQRSEEMIERFVGHGEVAFKNAS